MNILRQLSESALSADTQGEAMRGLSLGLGALLPCAVVGILDIESSGTGLFIATQETVSPDFISSFEQEMFERYTALTGHKLTAKAVRMETEGVPPDSNAADVPGSTFTVPIIANGEVMGLLTLAAKEENVYSATDISFLYHMANHLSTIFGALRRMKQLAIRDTMTGLYNRGHLEEELDRSWKLARRHNYTISVIIIDIDDFKVANDTYGHLVGDQILREFSDIVKRLIRTSDFVGRYGGDEVVMVLEHTDIDGGLIFAERILEAVHHHIFCENTHNIRLTASIGVACSRTGSDQEAGFSVLAEADQALYMAKRAGKNRVCGWAEETMKALPAVDTGDAAVVEPVQQERPGGHGSVLIVDDDERICKLLDRILSDAHYQTATALSISEAMEKFNRRPGGFDIVLTDINLPEESGFELIQKLDHTDDPVIKIVMTGDATVDNAVASLRYGVYDFIPKPIVPLHLLAVLSRAMEFRRLSIENTRYKRHLEDMVYQKSAALKDALSEVKTSYDFTLEALVAMLDAREQKTGQHSVRVRDMALILARACNVNDAELDDISHGALLHDIGKIGIPDAILLKPGPLTDDEWAVIRTHPDIGYRVLRSSSFLEKAADIVRSHQEKWDGTGYPRGLKGEGICLGARLFALVDAYDAMRSNRYYRNALSEEESIDEIRRGSGKQFDPKIVQAFLKCQPEIERIRTMRREEDETILPEVIEAQGIAKPQSGDV